MLAQADGHVRCGSCQKVFSAASQVSPIADNVEFEGYFEDLAYAVDDIAPVQPGQIDSADWLDDELIALAELDAERSGSDDELPEIDDDIFREIDSELNSLLADQVVSNEDDYPEAQGELKSPLGSESNARPENISEQDSTTSQADNLPELDHTSDQEHISGSDHPAEAADAPEETQVSERQQDTADNDQLSEKGYDEPEIKGEESEFEVEVEVEVTEHEIEIEVNGTESESRYQESKFAEHEQALESSTAFKESEKSLDTQEHQASPENHERQEPSISSEFFANLNLSTVDDESLTSELSEDINFNDIPTIEVLSQPPKPTNDGVDAEAEELDDASDANQEASSENSFTDKSSSVSDSTANPDELEALEDTEDPADNGSHDAIRDVSVTDDVSSEEVITDEASAEEIPEEESDIGDTIQPESQLSDDSEVGPLNDSIAPEDTAAINGIDDAEVADKVEQDESIHIDTTVLEEELSEDEYEYTHSDVSDDNEAENLHDDEYQPHLAEMDLQLQSSNRLPTLLWSCISLLLIAVLGAQIAWIKLPAWSAMEQYRPYYQQACELLSCELPTYDDIQAIEIIAFDLEADDTAGLLNVNISLRNNAAFPQRVPGLQLEFSSASGIPVDTLNYDIRQLLKTGPIDQLEPNEIIQLQLYVADPGDIATSYQAYIVKN